MKVRRYRGRRLSGGQVVVEFGEGRTWLFLPLADRLWLHSSEFEWGYAGSGPSQLALALLYHVTGRAHLSVMLHQLFKAEVVIHFSRQGWVLTREEILAWVLEAVESEHYCPSEYGLTGRKVDDA